MRHIVLPSVFVVALGPAVAAADEGVIEPLPARQMALTFVGHGSYVGNQSEDGMGANLEVAFGTGRVQAFAEASLSTAGLNAWTQSAYSMDIRGKVGRAAAGARWLARQWRFHEGGIELYLLATGGAERFWWDAGTVMTRPEVTAGWGVQARTFEFHDLAFRIEARVVFAPTDHAAAERVLCRGTCSSPMPDGSPAGFLTSMGVSL